MTTAYQRVKEIEQYRRVYFATGDGRQVLQDTLESLGLFADPAEWKAMLADPAANLRTMIEGLLLLKDLGVWTKENYGPLIEAMAGLPIPVQERNDDDDP
jgi:hypothetical protein